jgi:CHAT domain-containing protein
VHRLLVEPGNVANAWQNPARELFALRLFPLVDALTSTESLPAVRRLVVLPSLGMDGVPVETLLAASGRRDYTVSYAPSGTVFAWLREKRAAEPGRLARARRSRLLALGDPAFPPAEAPFGAEPPEHGAYVALVTPGSNAERHALRSGDVLVTYGGAVVSSADELGDLIQRRPLPEKAVAENEANDVALEVWRAGKTMRLTVAAGPLGVQLDKRSAADAVRTERQFGDFLRSTRSDAFQPLPGARREVQAIARLFPGAEMLLGQEASTGRLDELANSGRLGEFDVLHFATHGQLDQRSPLESALVLSCTDPPDSREQDLTGDTIYDGRLTAAHIMRLWKLNADLAVLSACETGLGKYSGGEGFVGFSQALLLAGAQSLVLSQWKVDDTATALLMVRFYENLLGKREGLKGPLSKTEALAESKRWLRELSADEVEKLVADLPAVERVGKATGAPRPAVKSARPFSHPYYWAAFILIGDPE